LVITWECCKSLHYYGGELHWEWEVKTQFLSLTRNLVFQIKASVCFSPFLTLGSLFATILTLFCSFISFFRFDRDWKKIEAFVGSKSVIQVILIEQKNFLCLKCRIIFSISQFKSRYFILVCSLKVSILSFSC